MKKNVEKFKKSFIGNDLKIGTRPDGTMFWLRNTSKNSSDEKDFIALEGGSAWVDKKTDTTILSFPTKNHVVIEEMKDEFNGNPGMTLDYTGSEYYVQLSECELNKPLTVGRLGHIGSGGHYKDRKLEGTGYIIDEDTFVRKNPDDGKLFFVKYSDFTQEDYAQDRFGWISALKRLCPDKSDEELLQRLQEDFIKESYGDIWIDEENGVLVLGPVVEQPPENLDEYHGEHISKLHDSLPLWEKTKYWIEVNPSLKRTPVNGKMFYWWGCLRMCSV